MHRAPRRGFSLALVILAVATAVAAPVGVAAAAPTDKGAAPGGQVGALPGAPPLVQVLTFGPGDHPFLKFGHDALRLQFAAEGRDDVYNFGTFAFEQSPSQLLSDFLARRLLYWLSRSSMVATSAVYRAENRTIRAQTLALDQVAALELQARLTENALPANRAYAYDYFFDNCATRVRDAVDRTVGGALHAVSHQPARMSFRNHALRLTADDWPVYLGLSIILGPLTDKPIDRWDEMFLPEVVAETLLAVRIPAHDGSLDRHPVPLVSEDVMLSPANRAPSRTEAPERRPVALLVGLLVGLLGAGLLRFGRRRGVRGVPGGLLLAAWGLLAGAIGSALALAWFGTPHLVAHGNQNLFLFPPTALLLVPLGLAGMSRARWVLRATLLVTGLGATLALGVSLAKLLSLVPFQQNGFWIALALPVWLGLTWGSWQATRCTKAREESNT